MWEARSVAAIPEAGPRAPAFAARSAPPTFAGHAADIRQSRDREGADTRGCSLSSFSAMGKDAAAQAGECWAAHRADGGSREHVLAGFLVAAMPCAKPTGFSPVTGASTAAASETSC
jgi:hypothetical protein